jgi:hypothetical protein
MFKVCATILPLFVLAAVLNSCYPMPTDDDYSLLPSTNNPEMTRQRAESAMPQMSM